MTNIDTQTGKQTNRNRYSICRLIGNNMWTLDIIFEPSYILSELTLYTNAVHVPGRDKAQDLISCCNYVPLEGLLLELTFPQLISCKFMIMIHHLITNISALCLMILLCYGYGYQGRRLQMNLPYKAGRCFRDYQFPSQIFKYYLCYCIFIWLFILFYFVPLSYRYYFSNTFTIIMIFLFV